MNKKFSSSQPSSKKSVSTKSYASSRPAFLDAPKAPRARTVRRAAEANAFRPTLNASGERKMVNDTLPKKRKSVEYVGKPKAETSWGPVAGWYDKHLKEGGDTYHEKVVYPNMLRILDEVKGKHVLDLACGQGQFSELLADDGAKVIGVDIGKELITLAEKNNTKHKFSLHYFVSGSHDLFMVKDKTQDIVVCILALQNIERLQETLKEVSRVLKDGGRFICVINHPSFRNPTHTHWGYDEEQNIQYRRVEEYLSESKIKIDMTPGSNKDKKFTVSFHRPLQVYVKALSKSNLAITRLEEWGSHKASEKGPRQNAENTSRKEIPLFMCIEAENRG